jgi:hypothetical protein
MQVVLQGVRKEEQKLNELNMSHQHTELYIDEYVFNFEILSRKVTFISSCAIAYCIPRKKLNN